MKVPPALGFYLRHADDAEALCELEERPNELPGEDWDRFQRVYQRASAEVADVLQQARDEAIERLAERATVISKSRRATVQRDWYANAAVKSKKAVRGSSLKLYVGASIFTQRSVRPWFIPYVACDGDASAVADLLQRVRRAGFKVDDVTEWFAPDSVALKLIPANADDDMNTWVKQAAEAYSSLANNWERLIR